MIEQGLYRQTLPLILWGASLAKTLTVGWPLTEASSETELADGSIRQRGRVTELDVWVTGDHALLRVTVPDIPGQTQDATYGERTGWDDTDGWVDFLEWAREGRPFTWQPDADDAGSQISVELLEPWDQAPTPGWAGRRTIQLTLRAVDPTEQFEGY